jgi:hypothetical protein
VALLITRDVQAVYRPSGVPVRLFDSIRQALLLRGEKVPVALVMAAAVDLDHPMIAASSTRLALWANLD